MDNKRTRRFLIVAFALSLLIHLILTGVIRWPFRLANDDVQTVTIEHLHTVHIAHVTPPPHTPAPKRVPVHLAKTTALNPKSSLTEGTVVTGTPVAPASTAPTPTPTPNCATNDTPVQMLASPPPPDLAPDPRAGRVSGVTRVRVLVDREQRQQLARSDRCWCRPHCAVHARHARLQSCCRRLHVRGRILRVVDSVDQS